MGQLSSLLCVKDSIVMPKGNMGQLSLPEGKLLFSSRGLNSYLWGKSGSPVIALGTTFIVSLSEKSITPTGK